MSDALQTNRCSVAGCDRIATTMHDGEPMCDRCADEWRTVGPLMADAARPRSGPLTSQVRRLAMRLILTIAALFGRDSRTN